MKYIGMAARAIYAAAVAFIGTLGAALTSDQNVSDVDAKTWCVIISATLLSFGGVYKITNRTTT